jgi:hypothetical protein
MSGGGDAVEDHRADAGAVLAQIDQRRACSIRSAIQIDALVAEIQKHVVEIVHRKGRRVEPDVGVVAGEAFLQSRERFLVRLCRFAKRAGVGPAVEGMRFAGPALVDQDDVAVAQHVAEHLADLTGQLRGALPGSAGEEYQRIRLLRAAERREDDDVEANPSARLRLPVLEHLETAAIRVDGGFLDVARLQPLERRPGAGRSARPRERQDQENEKGRASFVQISCKKSGEVRQRSR